MEEGEESRISSVPFALQESKREEEEEVVYVCCFFFFLDSSGFKSL